MLMFQDKEMEGWHPFIGRIWPGQVVWRRFVFSPDGEGIALFALSSRDVDIPVHPLEVELQMTDPKLFAVPAGAGCLWLCNSEPDGSDMLVLS